MDNSSSRSLRITLLAIGVANIAFATLFLFKPDTLSSLYEDAILDSMHLYLGSGLGAILIVLGIGAFLALAHPVRHSGIVLLLALAQFLLFLTDVIVLARGQMGAMTLLPEMIYFIITAALLIRYFPAELKEKEKIETPKVEKEDLDTPLFEENNSL